MVFKMRVLLYVFGALLPAVSADDAVELLRDDSHDTQNTATATHEELLCLDDKFLQAATLTDEEKMEAVFQCFPLLKERYEARMAELTEAKPLMDVLERRVKMRESFISPWRPENAEDIMEFLKEQFGEKPGVWDVLYMKYVELFVTYGFIHGIPNAFIAFLMIIVVASSASEFLFGLLHGQQMHIVIVAFFGICTVGGLVAYLVLRMMRVQRIVKGEL
ncbi:uncharacterized protein LOC129588927 [Paramacrobiotus metropolitanus]|uniref:uncharacterized protein LOC129588927 n=1 Tax=Paramacrobiotus metropolitanus TaxID=2943436 RepID=UPI0024465B94|nr:uncharacterized protein LOC129588927 [Paramacrobiotus metropolitanus]